MKWHPQKISRSAHAIRSVVIMSSCIAMLLACGCRVESPPQSTTTPSSASQDTDADSGSSKTELVTLEIYKPSTGSGENSTKSEVAEFTESFAATSGTTLEEIMRKMEQPKIVITGSGATAFVQSIDGVATNSSRGWTFTVDDEFANVGIGSLKLTPPQTIRWRFTTLEEATK
ncbi:DUF4430 domain-containing protein [Allorhodopirellula heiligendammensis]|uniref:Transcobalamin-like C-terminal domain-containing protein n=1 Tax=Allorhodopirellula heiligendammensis TaxID=2714739 RepID=A0A5C6C431_9BACT|nr:DUF4430 domain-containing protein [Allorhodopirellula heiligendammensis]TWU19340.1 hypothetical protein Poly21_15120 [Allorhodopirellula heiligendammensis]